MQEVYPRSCGRKRKLTALFAALVVLLPACAALTSCRDQKTGQNKPIVYFPADYDEDILKNEVYLSYDRDLYFESGGLEQAFNEDNVDSASRECRFFYDYFQCVIRGEYDDYPGFFYDPDAHRARFTMQMIYSVHAGELDPTEAQIDGKTVTLYNFSVRYAIHRNNGTFREGIRSDAVTKQVYQLLDTDQGFRIYRILDVEMKDENQ